MRSKHRQVLLRRTILLIVVCLSEYRAYSQTLTDECSVVEPQAAKVGHTSFNDLESVTIKIRDTPYFQYTFRNSFFYFTFLAK